MNEQHMKALEEILQYIEERIDPEHLDDVLQRNKDTLDFKIVAKKPFRIEKKNQRFKPFSMLEEHSSMAAMMYNALIQTANSVDYKDDTLPMIRANYGVGTVPSMFGLECEILNGNMPWVKHLDDENAVRELVSKGVPDINNGFGRRISQTHEFYREMLSKYEKCNKYIKIYHSDEQGHFDVAHLIWGSEIYMAIYDDEDLVHNLLDLCTQTIIKFMDRDIKEIDSNTDDGFMYHWNVLYKGKILLRDDSSVNLSKSMYQEFSKPYIQKIADHYGSIGVHFCGRADHWVNELLKMEKVDSVNFGTFPGWFDNDFFRMIKETCFTHKTPITGHMFAKEEYKNFDTNIFKTGLICGVIESSELYENKFKLV